MLNNNRNFDLTEEELIVLNTFFLSLPLPPVLMFKINSDQLNVENIIKQATSSLVQKALINSGNPDKSGQVDSDLLQILKIMAYANKMLHISNFSNDVTLQQQAFYLQDDQVIHQQVTNKGIHHLSTSENIPGDIIVNYFKNATEGQSGKVVIMPLESWHYLLSLRLSGDEQTGLQALSILTMEGVSADQQNRIEWSKEILIAPLVIEVISTQNRISSPNEKAVFVISKNNNWLVTERVSTSGQKIIRSDSMNRTNLHKSAQVLLSLVTKQLAGKE